jgi:hypothetical protein
LVGFTRDYLPKKTEKDAQTHDQTESIKHLSHLLLFQVDSLPDWDRLTIEVSEAVVLMGIIPEHD